MRGEDGNAMLEFVTVAVVLMVPLVSVMLAVFAVQRAAFAVSAAAREAGRAYVTVGPGRDAAEDAAQEAADLALADQLPGEPAADLAVHGGPEPGSAVTVVVRYEVRLAGGLATIPVTATHVATVDRYR